MSRLFLLLVLVLIAVISYRLFQTKAKNMNKQELFKLFAMVLLIAVAILALTGRLHWITVVLAALVPLLRNAIPALVRLFPLFQHLHKTTQANRNSNPGQTSTVNTAYLALHLNHDSGELSGEVLQGLYAGKQLADLDQQQLQELLEFYHTQDGESAQLLQAYISKRFGQQSNQQSNSQQDHQQRSRSSHSGDISHEEALAILGLSEPYTKDDVIKAHRKLMQKLHPDRGGNDYLAAKVNRAKDVLLKSL